jgi:ferredoxin
MKAHNAHLSHKQWLVFQLPHLIFMGADYPAPPLDVKSVQMRVNNTDVLVCDCGDTMTIDAKALAKGCSATGECNPATSLCRSQTDRLASAMQAAAADGRNVLVACTQETDTFAQIAEEISTPAPHTVNIREMAGWSDEGSKSSPKMAALIANSLTAQPPVRSMALESQGRCLIYADAGTGGSAADAAFALATRLSGDLGVTVLISNLNADLMAQNAPANATTGTIRSATGHFTSFKLVIDQFAEALPHGRESLLFGGRSDGVETSCDILIDLSGGTPLFTGWEKRDGYFRVAVDDSVALAALEAQVTPMIGEFEKPIYVNFDENLCAHSRNRIDGCSRCLNVCPAGAISSAGDTVSIDPAICGGCGFCGAVCPSGAVQTAYPPVDGILGTIDRLVDTYQVAGGKTPALLLHDESFGVEAIEMMARYGRGLPAHVLPLALHDIGRAGHDLMVGAIALGCNQVFVLANPRKTDETHPVGTQIELARELLAGVNADADGRLTLINESDPDTIATILYDTKCTSKTKPAPFAPVGTPRGMVRLAMRGLGTANKATEDVIALPQGAPYGRVNVDTENCTICLSCVSACPAGALQDNPDAPQLLFREDACLQCGICATTCPENVISLIPQFNLSDTAMAAEMVVEDTPFHCTSCGKAFGSTRSIERVIAKLSDHSMFQQEGRTDMLKLCENCRVEVMFTHNDKTLDVGERPKPRTTDDYLN